MQNQIVKLLLNECKQIILKHSEAKNIPNVYIIKYCKTNRFDIARCIAGDSNQTWKYENGYMKEVTNSVKASKIEHEDFYENGAFYFGFNLSNQSAYVFYLFGKRRGSSLSYRISIEDKKIELTEKKLLGMF